MNHRKAQRLLAQLSRSDLSSGQVSVRFRQIAHLLLCCRNHQDQADDVVQEWEDKLDEYLESTTESEDEEDDVSSEDDEEEVEPILALRRQMTELHGVLRRVETALATNLAQQQRISLPAFEASNHSDSTGSLVVQVPDSPVRTGVESNDTNTDEAQPEQLNLDHVQALVTQLNLESEREQRSQPSVDNGQGEEPTANATASATSGSDSPQTVTGRDTEPTILDSEQAATDHPPTPQKSHSDTDERSRTTESPATIIATSDSHQDTDHDLTVTHANIQAPVPHSPETSSMMWNDRLLGNTGEQVYTSDVHESPVGSKGTQARVLWPLAIKMYIGVFLIWLLI